MNQFCFSGIFRVSTTHGGELAHGKRKTARPIATCRPMHLVIRSSRAKGDKSFLHPRHARFISDLVGQLAGENFIRVYRYANVGNHPGRGREPIEAEAFLPSKSSGSIYIT